MIPTRKPTPRKALARLLLLALTLAAAGCTGTETGNPFAGQVGFDSPTREVIVPEPEASAIWLALDDLDFVPDGRCEGRRRGLSALSEPVLVPFAGAGATQTLALHEGDYCGVDLTVGPGAPAPAVGPADLEGASFLLEGALADETPLRIRSAASMSIVLDAGAPFPLEEALPPVALVLDLQLLLRGVDWASARREPDGTVLLDAEHNADLLAVVVENLSTALFVYRDSDGDGAIDMAETGAGPLAGP